MEQSPVFFTAETPAIEYSLERHIDFTHRINSLIQTVETLIDMGAADTYKVDGVDTGLSFQQDGRWKGVSLQTATVASKKDQATGEQTYSDLHCTSLQRRSDGTARVIVETSMTDDRGVEYTSTTRLQFSPYRPLVEYEADGVVYDRESGKPFDVPLWGTQSDLHTSIEIILYVTEQSTSEITRQALKNISGFDPSELIQAAQPLSYSAALAPELCD